MGDSEKTMTREGCTGIRETSKALLVRLKDGAMVWVPKSVIHDDSEVYEKDYEEGKLVVQRWWAEREEWEDDDDTDD